MRYDKSVEEWVELQRQALLQELEGWLDEERSSLGLSPLRVVVIEGGLWRGMSLVINCDEGRRISLSAEFDAGEWKNALNVLERVGLKHLLEERAGHFLRGKQIRVREVQGGNGETLIVIAEGVSQ